MIKIFIYTDKYLQMATILNELISQSLDTFQINWGKAQKRNTWTKKIKLNYYRYLTYANIIYHKEISLMKGIQNV